MNNEGDFFIGNKRVSSSTGQEKTFDAPVPTVTGEDPSRLSVVFDEVVIKEDLKLKVEHQELSYLTSMVL